jgi:4-hydroxy-tetrahydrodipicolinate reductase
MLRTAVAGASGRMGRMLVRAIVDSAETSLAAAVERPGHADLGRDAGELAGMGRLGVALTADVAAALAAVDVWIDFSSPAAAVQAAAHAAAQASAHKVALVIGTTGFDSTQREQLARAAEHVPAVVSANMSVGVNVLALLVEQAARALGPDFDPEIVELHHRHKLDAPSGTALLLADAVGRGSGRDPRTSLTTGRKGPVGARSAGEIGVLAVRGGDVVGDHTVYLLGPGERLELSHRASSRETFARGAVRAALWTRGQPPGLYDMRHVLGMAG